MRDPMDDRTADWIGAPQAATRAPSRDTRPSVADAKAVAALQLGELINKIPPRIKAGGTVNEVREYRAARTAAAKVAGSSRSSVSQLNSAINNMRRFFA